jgi:hypothetical protein
MDSEYKTTRTVGKELTTKIFAQLSKEEITRAAKTLGWLERGVIIFPDTNGIDIMTDFCLFELRTNDQNLVQRYLSSSELLEGERSLLSAMTGAFNSCFQVISTNGERGQVYVRDLLNQNNSVTFTDYGLSKSLMSGTLIYTRLISLPNFFMTSGVVFPFSSEHKKIILKGYDFENFKKRGRMSSKDLFLFFLKKSEKYGMPYRTI